MTNYEEVLELANTVLSELTTRGLIISIAESCTGGMVSSFLTDLNDASMVFNTGIVTYSNDSKEEFLGVPGYVFDNFGSISLECAKIMAEGIAKYDADIGAATTGVIGESIENKLRGTAFIAVAVDGQRTFAKELTLNPNLSRYDMKLEITKNLFQGILETIDAVY